MAASTSSWFFRDEEEEDEEEPNNKLQSLLDQSDSTILKCLRRKAREDKNFLFWNFSPSDDVEEDDVYEPVNESQTAPNRASALVQVTLYANGYSTKLLVPNNGNNGRNGDSGNDEVFLPYEDSFNSESGLLEYLDAGQTPPALFDLLQLRFPERINQIECCYGQEVEVLVKDCRHITPESSSTKDSSLTIDTQLRLKSSQVTTLKVIRQKIVTLNHEKRRVKLNIETEESGTSSKGKGKNSTANEDPSGSSVNEAKPKAKRKRKAASNKNLDATPEEIESQVIFDCSEPLCLDPSPIVCLIENKLIQSSRLIQSSPELMKFTRRGMIDCNRYVNKKLKQQLPKEVRKDGGAGGRSADDAESSSSQDFAPLNVAESLTDFLSRKSDRRTPAVVRASMRCKTRIGSGDYPISSETPKMMDIDQTFAEINKIASRKALASSIMNRNFTDNSLLKVEEYLMEFDVHQPPPINAANGQQQLPPPTQGMTAISIFHRPIDEQFFGQLFVDRAGQTITDRSNWTEELRARSSSRSCLFRLGSRETAKAYLEQFTEILSENGRKSVRITRSGVGAGIPQIQQPRQNPQQPAQQQSSVQHQTVQQLQQTLPPPPPPTPPSQPPPQKPLPSVHNPHQCQLQQPQAQKVLRPSFQGYFCNNYPLPYQVKLDHNLQPLPGSEYQVVRTSLPPSPQPYGTPGTKVILPAPVQQIQPIPNSDTLHQQQQQQEQVSAQILPKPIAPAPQPTVQMNNQSNTLGNITLSSLLQQPIQVVQNSTVTQVPSSTITAPVTVPNQARAMDVQQAQISSQQQQLIHSLQQGSTNQQHVPAALDGSQMRPGQSWIVLPPNNLVGNNVPNSGMVAPAIAGQSVTVPVSQAVGINQTFRPFQVILWPQQQQQTLNVQPMIRAQHVQAAPVTNGPVTMTLTQIQQQQIQNQIQQQQQQQQNQNQQLQQQSHP